MMRIRLIRDLPIEKKHGAVRGKEYVVTFAEKGRGARVFFEGDAGEQCAAFRGEYELVEEK